MGSTKPLFGGLIVDEEENPVDVRYVGGESFYVVDDHGFMRHVSAEGVDRQVLEQMGDLIRGHEELISEGTMKALGQDDIFSKAVIERSLKNLESQFDAILSQGLPEEARAWLGMMGFRVHINAHGEVIRVDQPAAGEEPPE
jgi:hypothetical protein